MNYISLALAHLGTMASNQATISTYKHFQVSLSLQTYSRVPYSALIDSTGC